MDTEDRTVSKDTTTSTPEETDIENSSTEIVAVADMHLDAPVVQVTEIYDEPPKEIPNIVKKGDKFSAKGLTKKKTQPNESDPNSFDVENEKDRQNGTGRMRFFINGGSGK